jgi:DNA-binding IclR family transcriptional regulator
MKVNKSASRAMDVLDLVAERRELLTITEIGRILEIPKSTAFELVHALVEKGYLEIDKYKQKTFKLGLKAFQTGIAYLEKTDFFREIRPLLEGLMEQSRETVFLVQEASGKVVYVDKVESTASVKTSSILGSTNPMHCTGVGKALLAAYGRERVKEIITRIGLASKTPYSFTNFEQLMAELDATRARGYSIDNRESELEIFCVAAPVYDMTGNPIAAISIASPASRMLGNPHRVKQLGHMVNETALAASRRLGYRGNKLFPV